MSDFKNLLVWQKAHALGIHTYRVAKGIRRAADVATRSQLVRAAMSIPTNIVEGRRQSTDKEFARFLRIALNSAFELEYHLLAARDMELISKDQAATLLEQLIEVRRMLHGLLDRLGNDAIPNKPLSA
ncbi:MAG TPA: four helix bundle protein [Gemmatimonadaceae bacterium]|nr:four helix bundle protein [Gemmatimonadaceae bacterium]